MAAVGRGVGLSAPGRALESPTAAHSSRLLLIMEAERRARDQHEQRVKPVRLHLSGRRGRCCGVEAGSRTSLE